MTARRFGAPSTAFCVEYSKIRLLAHNNRIRVKRKIDLMTTKPASRPPARSGVPSEPLAQDQAHCPWIGRVVVGIITHHPVGDAGWLPVEQVGDDKLRLAVAEQG